MATGSPSPAGEFQFQLKESLIATTVIAVILGISRVIGGLGVGELMIFLVGISSSVFASAMRKRWYVWPLAGLLLMLPLVFLPIPFKPNVVVAFFLLYGFTGSPIAIASARGLHMKRWWISEISILTVSVALTGADPISTLLVYCPLQLAMLGYVFFAKDGPIEEPVR